MRGAEREMRNEFMNSIENKQGMNNGWMGTGTEPDPGNNDHSRKLTRGYESCSPITKKYLLILMNLPDGYRDGVRGAPISFYWWGRLLDWAAVFLFSRF
ncbi:MAG TPA: hypothetical protein VD927_05140 [Chryseosolibacter sp.]|nr:hypothetical protein [Chryseosolibacter sp.]